MLTATGLRTHIWNNNLRSVFLLAAFPVLLILLVYGLSVLFSAFAGGQPVDAAMIGAAESMPRIAPWAFGASAIWFTIAWFSHSAMIDRATGAHGVSPSEEPRAYKMLENLSISRGMTVPKLKVMETPVMNAYASGLREGQYSVTLTRGLMESLPDDELEAVIGHELAHIRHKDVRLLVISIVFVGIFSFVFEMFVRNIFRVNGGRLGNHRRSGEGNAAILIMIAVAIVAVAYLLAVLLRFALSRKREYMADAGSVELTKDPDAMIRALQRISGNAYLPDVPADVREMMFENPRVGFAGVFATHPPIGKRIEALVRYAGGRVSPDTVTSSPNAAAVSGRRPPRQRAGRRAPGSRPRNPWH